MKNGEPKKSTGKKPKNFKYVATSEISHHLKKKKYRHLSQLNCDPGLC